MHVVVCMKQVVDLEQLRIRAETREPVLEGLPLKLGDFEKRALEAAVQLRERGEAERVTVVASGTTRLRDSIKEALAMGADDAVLLTDPAFQGADAAGSAKLLAAAIRRLQADLALFGEGSDDEYSGQIPPRVAEIMGWPQVTYVRQLELVADGELQAVLDFEDELETVRLPLPAVVGVTSELNEPRLPPLTDILKAARKPVVEWGPDELGVTARQAGAPSRTVEVISNLAPEQDRKGVIYEDVEEGVIQLIAALRHEGVL